MFLLSRLQREAYRPPTGWTCEPTTPQSSLTLFEELPSLYEFTVLYELKVCRLFKYYRSAVKALRSLLGWLRSWSGPRRRVDLDLQPLNYRVLKVMKHSLFTSAAYASLHFILTDKLQTVTWCCLTNQIYLRQAVTQAEVARNKWVRD